MIADWVGIAGVMAANTAVSVGIIKHLNDKTGRIYKRLDDIKEKFSTEFVRKDLCSVMHLQASDNLTGLETRINDRFDKLEKTVSDQYSMLIKIITEKK